jgi:hypothetical protein
MTIGAQTNAIYQDVVDAAVAVEIDLLRTGVPLEDEGLLRTFGSATAIMRELRRLQQLNSDTAHFELGAYHNALLHAVVPGFIDSLNDMAAYEPLSLCGGRFTVSSLDVGAFTADFFADLDFTWPADLVNELTQGGKRILGLDDGVFGVANELAPTAKELEVIEVDARDAVRQICELTKAMEADLRRQASKNLESVKQRVAQLGLLYRTGAAFPYTLDWLEP